MRRGGSSLSGRLLISSATLLQSFAEFGRTDGPADAIAHGYLADGPISLFAADVSGDELSLRCEGIMLSLLGAAAPHTLRDWFARLSDGGRVIDELQTRTWGATDGQVIDRHGIHWLIGFEGDESD
jgi:PhnB protein